jgi:hypothetical protein
VQAVAPKPVLEAVVAAHHDVEQAVRRTRVGIIVLREQEMLPVERETEQIPKAGGDELKPASIGPATENASTLSLAAVRGAISAFERVPVAQVLALADVKPVVV